MQLCLVEQIGPEYLPYVSSRLGTDSTLNSSRRATGAPTNEKHAMVKSSKHAVTS